MKELVCLLQNPVRLQGCKNRHGVIPGQMSQKQPSQEPVVLFALAMANFCVCLVFLCVLVHV